MYVNTRKHDISRKLVLRGGSKSMNRAYPPTLKWVGWKRSVCSCVFLNDSMLGQPHFFWNTTDSKTKNNIIHTLHWSRSLLQIPQSLPHFKISLPLFSAYNFVCFSKFWEHWVFYLIVTKLIRVNKFNISDN